jgi:hypothetical protein
VAANLNEGARRPERGGELCARKTWLSSWQWFRWSPDMHPVSHHGEDQRRGTWRATAAARRRWDLSGRPTARGDGKRSCNSSASGSDAEILIEPCLSDGHGARIMASNRSTAMGYRRQAWGGIGIFCSWTFTVPWWSPIRWTDREIWSMIYSQFCVVTKLALCTKIIAWQTSYNFVTAILIKFSTIQAWIHTQSWLYFTENLNFRMDQPDSQTWGLIISDFFLNNYAHNLKQSCSPMIGL